MNSMNLHSMSHVAYFIMLFCPFNVVSNAGTQWMCELLGME